MITFKIIAGDPGKTNDPFGMVGLEATWPDRKIYIRFAKQFKNVPYGIIANHFQTMMVKFDTPNVTLEKNFDYENVYKAFAKLNVKYVNTTANLTEKNRNKGWSVDKPYMIKWLKAENKIHTIQYPAKRSADVNELINQQNEIVGILSASGHTSYKRVRNRHDDLFMAKLIACNTIRMWWDYRK